MKLSYKLLIALALLTATNAQASLMKTQDTLAVCSNGEQATFVVSESKSNTNSYLKSKNENYKRDIRNSHDDCWVDWVQYN